MNQEQNLEGVELSESVHKERAVKSVLPHIKDLFIAEKSFLSAEKNEGEEMVRGFSNQLNKQFNRVEKTHGVSFSEIEKQKIVLEVLGIYEEENGGLSEQLQKDKDWLMSEIEKDEGDEIESKIEGIAKELVKKIKEDGTADDMWGVVENEVEKLREQNIFVDSGELFEKVNELYYEEK